VMAVRRGRFGAPEMLRGTVVTHRRRCGKQNCRCTTAGELHESVVLSYSAAKRTKFVMLRPDEVEIARAATERFRVAKAKLEETAQEGLAQLLARRTQQA
jgi:hypothetical protein